MKEYDSLCTIAMYLAICVAGSLSSTSNNKGACVRVSLCVCVCVRVFVHVCVRACVLCVCARA